MSVPADMTWPYRARMPNTTHTESVAAFRALHHAEQPLLLPNAWDYASAAALAAAGFPAIGTTSLGVALAAGLPDAEGKAREETAALAGRLGELPCLITVDIEAGFSDDPAEVADLVGELADSGIVGINLEDSRASGMLADPNRQVELIAEVKARAPEAFLNARTDTYWLGSDAPDQLSHTIARAERYVAAGADGLFVPGIADEADIRAVVNAIPVPLNVLYLEHGHGLDRLAGFGVSRISTGSLLFRVAVHAAVTAAQAIRDGERLPDGVPGYAEMQRLVTGRSGGGA